MTTIRKRVEALDENKRFEARAHWERCYDTALALLMKDGLKPNTGTSESFATRAALIADRSLLQWMERW